MPARRHEMEHDRSDELLSRGCQGVSQDHFGSLIFQMVQDLRLGSHFWLRSHFSENLVNPLLSCREMSSGHQAARTSAPAWNHDVRTRWGLVRTNYLRHASDNVQRSTQSRANFPGRFLYSREGVNAQRCTYKNISRRCRRDFSTRRRAAIE